MEGGSLLKKNIDSSIEENNEKGAKILATGSSSCIFHPNIPCKKSNDDITKEKISKIVYGSKSDKYFKREMVQNTTTEFCSQLLCSDADRQVDVPFFETHTEYYYTVLH